MGFLLWFWKRIESMCAIFHVFLFLAGKTSASAALTTAEAFLYGQMFLGQREIEELNSSDEFRMRREPGLSASAMGRPPAVRGQDLWGSALVFVWIRLTELQRFLEATEHWMQ